ncbi:MAG: hypothetical protein ACKVHE_26405 [Planctomycetales bacterium]|jgi:hypothetical protein
MGNGDSATIRPRWKKTELFGLLMMLTGLAVFAILAAQLGTPSVQRFDETIIRNLRSTNDIGTPVGPNWFKELTRDFTALGGYGILSTITILVTTFLHLERRPARAHFVVVTVVAGYSLSMMLKSMIARPRPDIVPWLSHVELPERPLNDVGSGLPVARPDAFRPDLTTSGKDLSRRRPADNLSSCWLQPSLHGSPLSHRRRRRLVAGHQLVPRLLAGHPPLASLPRSTQGSFGRKRRGYITVGQAPPDEVVPPKMPRQKKNQERHGRNRFAFRVFPFIPWLNPRH